MINVLKVALGLALIAGVGCTSSAVKAPPRPAKVPATAIWAGGSDGGAFIECGVRPDGYNDCTVYNDYTGDTWMQGVYAIKGKNRGATSKELVYLFADGKGIGLANGDYLVRR